MDILSRNWQFSKLNFRVLAPFWIVSEFRKLWLINNKFEHLFNPRGVSDQLVVNVNFAEKGWAKRS